MGSDWDVDFRIENMEFLIFFSAPEDFEVKIGVLGFAVKLLLWVS